MPRPIHCCDRLREQVEFCCDMHPERASCPDYLVGYFPTYDEYGIWVHDGEDGSGNAFVTFEFCMFCGTELPPSRRDEWFERLWANGLEPEDATEEARRYGWWL